MASFQKKNKIYVDLVDLTMYNESIGIISSRQKLLVKTQKHTGHEPKSVQNQRVVDQQHNLILLTVTSQSLEFCNQGFTKFYKREIFLQQKPRIDSRRVSVEHTFLRHTLSVGPSWLIEPLVRDFAK